MQIYLDITQCVIKIEFLTSSYTEERLKLLRAIKKYYQGFILKKAVKKPHYTITVTDTRQAVTFFNNKTNKGYMYYYSKINLRSYKTFYFISIFQFQLLLQELLLEFLSNNGGFMLHASSNKVNNKAVIFVGKSGSGKSTIMTLLRSKYQALASDSIFIKKVGSKYFAFQTPFFEKDMWVQKESGKTIIDSFYFINQNKKTYIQKINNTKQNLHKLINCILVNNKIKEKQKTMSSLIDFVKQNQFFYKLYFTKNKTSLYKVLASGAT